MIKNIRNYLYHGVTNDECYLLTDYFRNPYRYSIAKFESILKTRYILPRETINKDGIVIPNINSDNNIDVISFVFHSSNEYLKENYQNTRLKGTPFFEERAYDTFLNQISIILNSRLLCDLRTRDKDYPTMVMPDEIQVLDPISIEYFEGIGLKYYPYKNVYIGNGESEKYYRCDKELRDIVKEILNEQDLDIPIVDLVTGNDLFEVPLEYKVKMRRK